MKKPLSFFILLLSLYSNAQRIGAVNSNSKNNSGSFQSKYNKAAVDIWDEVENYVNGFARVLKSDKFSLINTSGNLIAKVEFDGARNFSHHLAAVEKNGQWGFINEQGINVIPFQFEIAYDFKSDVTAVFSNKKWMIIDQAGKIINTPDIDVCYGFKNGTAQIEKSGRKGVMFENGTITFSGSESAPKKLSQRIANNPTNNAIGSCPNNLDFENGNFTGWRCFVGSVDTIGTTNIVKVNPSAPLANRHRIISRSNPSVIDPFGLFPINPPDGSNFAVKLGNTNIGAQAERIRYTIRVPLNDSNFSIKYDYAVVFQDPGHTAWSQPRFVARLFDSAANKYVDCASFEYISTSNLPGFALSKVDSSVIYKPWSSVFISMRAFAGKTMVLEFTTADCVRRGHWGYAYVDVQSICGEAVQMQYDCNYPNETILDAPPGFEIYKWWNKDFTRLLAQGQHAVLNPGPPANSTIWVEMIPYNNYGCTDTMPVRIYGSFTPSFKVSEKNVVCAPRNISFYNNNTPSVSAVWEFGDGTTATGDTVNHTFLSAGTYVVTLTVTLPSGCIGKVIDTIRITSPTVAVNYAAGNFCNNQTVNFEAIGNNVDSLVWNFGDGNIITTSQLVTNYSYNTAGTFVPSVKVYIKGGCELNPPLPDTIRIEKVNAEFNSFVSANCTATSVLFKDSSYSNFGITGYTWDFGDQTGAAGASVNHVYTSTGNYSVRLIAVGKYGCSDTVIYPVAIRLLTIPNISINATAQSCEKSAVNFTSTIQSADSIASVLWISSDGKSGIGSQFSNIFNQSGNYTVRSIVNTIYGCADTANHAITINAIPQFATTGNQEVCAGQKTNQINLTSNIANTVFSWQNDNTSVGLPASGNGNIPSFTTTNQSSNVMAANVKISASANGCSAPTQELSINVKPLPVINKPTDQTLCNKDNTTPIVFSGNANDITYNWSNNTTSIGLTASGSGNIASFVAANVSNVLLIANITVTPTRNGCAGAPVNFNISVKPTPSVISVPDQSVCSGSNINAIAFGGNTTGAIYSWSNDQIATGLAASGTGNIAAFTATNISNQPAVSNITVTPTLNGCAGADMKFAITVNPLPDAIRLNDIVVCNGAVIPAVDMTLTLNRIPSTVINWTNTLSSIGLSASGTGNIPSFTAVNNTNNSVNADIKVTASAYGCSNAPITYKISVKPTPSVTSVPDQSVCSGSNINAISFGGNTLGATYSWTNDQIATGLASSGTGNIAAFTATNTSNQPAVSNITVTPTLNGCGGADMKFVITVNPLPDAIRLNDQASCSKEILPAIDLTGGANRLPSGTFNWVNNTPAIGLPASGKDIIPSFTTVNSTDKVVNAIVTVTPSSYGCAGAPVSYRIAVNPVPVVSAVSNQTVCNGANTNVIQFTSGTNSVVYDWTNDQSSIGLAAAGTGNIPSFKALNNSATVLLANISVTPKLNGCIGDAKRFNIVVNPSPVISQPADVTVCNSQRINGINLSSNIAGSTFRWSNSNPVIGLSNSGTGNIPSFTAVNSGGQSLTSIITITGTANGCNSEERKMQITVAPSLTIAPMQDKAVCSGGTVESVAINGSISGVTYQWTNTRPMIGLPASGTGNIPAFVAKNNAEGPLDAVIQVTANNFGNCPSASRTFRISVNPLPSVNAGSDKTVCKGSSTNITASGAVQYSWSPSAGLSCTECPNPVATVQSQTAYAVEGKNAYGCKAIDSVMLKVIEPFDMIVSPDDTICSGGSVQLRAMKASKYEWSPATGLSATDIATPVANPTASTTYRVIGYDENNCFTDTAYVYVTVGPNPTVEIGPNLSVATGSTVNFQPTYTNGPIARWNWNQDRSLSCTNCPNPTARVENNTTYTLSVENIYGCRTADTVLVTVFCKSAQFFLPNAFTPDGDGLNDKLMIRGAGITVKSFRIFNRWGNLVFEKTNFMANDPNYAWDGMVRGVPVNPDVYVYTAEVTCDNGTVYMFKGNTTVLK